jgi:two-component system KDP operon response regulator KdpE
MGKKVLLIDDDMDLGRVVEITLRSIGAAIYQAFSGREGLKLSYQLHPDLIILDIMMPDMDGFEVCHHLRELTDVPILMLTARTRDCDMLRGFNLGVDDYMKKPFNPNELEARVRALLKRLNAASNGPAHMYSYSYIDPVLEIDLNNQTVKLCGEILYLSPREYEILAYLVREQGKIVPHHELVHKIWGGMQLNAASNISFYICNLRKKLQDGSFGHRYIRTNWGRGYWFEARKEE